MFFFVHNNLYGRINQQTYNSTACLEPKRLISVQMGKQGDNVTGTELQMFTGNSGAVIASTLISSGISDWMTEKGLSQVHKEMR